MATRRVLISKDELDVRLDDICGDFQSDPGGLLIIGVDTGLKGGVAFMPAGVRQQNLTPFVIPMPILTGLGTRKTNTNKKTGKKTKSAGKTGYDRAGIVWLFEHFRQCYGRLVLGIEQTQPSGGRSMGRTDTPMTGYAMGRGYEIWTTLAECLGIRIEEMRPQQWKKIMDLSGAGKPESFRKARAMWPQLQPYFALKSDEGRAEAMLIAEATRRKVGITL